MSKIRRIACNKWFITAASMLALVEASGAPKKW
jgi:hypothetical protein